MSDGYVSPYDTSQHRLRLFAVCSISALVEVLRYSAHPEQYVGLLPLAAFFGPAVNCIFHHWNMPDSLTKASDLCVPQRTVYIPLKLASN